MPKQHRKNSSSGFTLIEILVALAITSILVTAIYRFFIGQHHAYTVQDQVIEMEQNARAAMDLIRRDMRMAGYNAMGKELLENLSTVVPNDYIKNSPLPIHLGTNPIKITKGSVAESDVLTFLSVASTSTNPTTIVEDAEAGIGNITLNLSFSDTSKQFNPTDIFHLGFSSDYGIVTDITSKSVDGKTKGVLHFEVIPKENSGGATGLSKKYLAGSPIGEIYVVSYAVIQDDDGKSVLKRKRNAGNFDPIAENITKMKIDPDPATGELVLALTSRTDRPDHKFQLNNGYRTYTAASRIKVRNVDKQNVDVGTDCPLPDAPATVSLNGLDETDPCKISITWDAVTVSGEDCEVTGYKVFYGTSHGFYVGSVDVGNVTNYTLDMTGLNACIYYISVAALNSAGTGVKSDIQSITDFFAPVTPTGFSAENINGVERKTLLSWDKNSECDLQGYNIEKKSDSETGFGPISNSIISKGLDTYTDIGFGTPDVIENIDCATYSYRIQAEDYCLTSEWSTEVPAAPTAPAPPTGPIFSSTATDTLSWTLSTDDFDVNGLNYITEYRVYIPPENSVLPENSVPVDTLEPGTTTWTSTSLNPYYDVSAYDACGKESEKLRFSSACIDTLPQIAITSPSENQTFSGTVTIEGTATATSDISKVRLKIDDTEWVDLTGTESWSYNWNTRGEVEGAHTIFIGAYDSQNCYTQKSVSVSVSNSNMIVQDLQCKLFGCGGADEYAYLLAYVYDAADQKPVSGAAIAADIAVGPNFYELISTEELGYYGGDLTPPSPCTMKTDDNETPITNNIAIKSQQKFRSGTVTIRVKKDDKESTCSWTLSDGSGQ